MLYLALGQHTVAQEDDKSLGYKRVCCVEGNRLQSHSSILVDIWLNLKNQEREVHDNKGNPLKHASQLDGRDVETANCLHHMVW